MVLAVATAGSLAGAARTLGVHHTTVLRRLAGLESRLQARLFERLPTGYVLTPAGEQFAEAARQAQVTITDSERLITGQDRRLTGVVRVTTTDTLALSILPAALAGFAAVHPQVQLELTTTNALLNLSRRDADIAVRPGKKPPDNLVGRRVATVAFALYASPSYLERRPASDDLERHGWLAPDDSLAGTSIARWMARTLGSAPVVLRADTLTALWQAAEAGLGVAALPCYLGDTSSVLQRVREVIAPMAVELWLLTHGDLRRTTRIRALADWLATALGRERDLLEGHRPRVTPVRSSTRPLRPS